VQKKSWVLLMACLLISLILGGCTNMQDKTVTTTTKFPDKPITLIVPFGVGGGMDLVARLLEKSAPTHLGQPLVILNKPGGAGALGWNELANAIPDGYTLGISGAEILLQPLYGQTKYHYPTALEPIAQISESPQIMAVLANQPWQNLNDLIAYAKQHPGQLKFGHAGVGSINHIVGESFGENATIHIEQVPYQSAAEVMTSLLGGHVQIAILTAALGKEQMKSGIVRTLAIGSEQRLTDPVFANVPTFKEQGFNIVDRGWFGIAAPKDLPLDVKNKLADGFKAMINDPEFKKNIENLGLQVNYLDPQESAERWLDDGEKLTKTVQETGILVKINEQKK
jgi:tripartite-type tricarboxylate transporter receptor subunit TctC